MARVDLLCEQMEALSSEIQGLLAEVEEAGYLLTIPGLSWVSAAGLIAHVGRIDKYQHGRQLIKLAGTNPSRRDTGQKVGGYQGMTHRGRAGLRQVLYMATLSCLQHNPCIRAHFDRLDPATRPTALAYAGLRCLHEQAAPVCLRRHEAARGLRRQPSVEGGEPRILRSPRASALRRREDEAVRCHEPGRFGPSSSLPPGHPRSLGQESG